MRTRLIRAHGEAGILCSGNKMQVGIIGKRASPALLNLLGTLRRIDQLVAVDMEVILLVLRVDAMVRMCCDSRLGGQQQGNRPESGLQCRDLHLDSVLAVLVM